MRSSDVRRHSRCSRPCRRSAAAGRVLEPLGVQERQRGAQRLERVAPDGHALRRRAEPGRDTVALGERRRAAHADEGVARPHAAVLGGLEQVRAGPLVGQGAVQRDRRLAVGEQRPGDRDDPTVARERAERLEVGRDGSGGHSSSPRRSTCGRRCGRPHRPGRP